MLFRCFPKKWSGWEFCDENNTCLFYAKTFDHFLVDGFEAYDMNNILIFKVEFIHPFYMIIRGYKSCAMVLFVEGPLIFALGKYIGKLAVFSPLKIYGFTQKYLLKYRCNKPILITDEWNAYVGEIQTCTYQRIEYVNEVNFTGDLSPKDIFALFLLAQPDPYSSG